MNPGDKSQQAARKHAEHSDVPVLDLPPGFVLVKTADGRMAVVPEDKVKVEPVVAVAEETRVEPEQVISGEIDNEPEVQVAPFIAPHDDTPVKKENGFVRAWRKIGGGSLTFSILIHVGLLILAGLIVLAARTTEQSIDFLPGGGSQQGAEASSDLAEQVRVKKQMKIRKSIPMSKVVSTSMNADIILPEVAPDLLDVPDVSATLGGGMKSGGFGKGGSGGGFGSGQGSGGLSGIAFKPVMMFGKELKGTKKIAVVMDVSRSMTKYLPIVAKELDKVARGSPLVLYFGCGLKTPPRQLEDKIRKVGDERFDKFWYYWEGKHEMDMLRKEYDKLKVPTGDPMPMEALYHQMRSRPNTYFIDFNGITYTSPALMCKEVMEADTLYWFSDFQDAVDVEHVKDVMRKLRGRKQKLYMHASVRGKSFEILRDELCLPLGGQVLETKVE